MAVEAQIAARAVLSEQPKQHQLRHPPRKTSSRTAPTPTPVPD
jgi:hypothetical protein